MTQSLSRMNRLVTQVKSHPDFKKAGMVLTHNGVVRETSADGRQVTGLTVGVDHKKLNAIVDQAKKRPGIVEVVVEIVENERLNVGDDVMYIVVAGDVRERVITTLSETLNEIKATVTTKTEFFQ